MAERAQQVAGVQTEEQANETGPPAAAAAARCATGTAVASCATGVAVASCATDSAPPDRLLPDVGDTARSLALCVAEILTGAREVDTIARWITEEVHRHLQQRAAIAARARSVSRRSQHRAVIRVGGVVLDASRGDVVEAAVVVHTRSHARAVAIRLEARQGRWRATAIGVL